MDEIVWEDPPTPKVGRPPGGEGVWTPALLALAERPGTWAKIREGRSERLRRLVTTLRQGKVAYPAGLDPSDFEFVSRKMDADGSGAIFGRYTPKPKAVSA